MRGKEEGSGRGIEMRERGEGNGRCQGEREAGREAGKERGRKGRRQAGMEG